MCSLGGLPGCSIDFVTLHYQFSDIEFYEPNTMQQEVHIKMLACFLHQMWLSSCFCLLYCLHLLFSCQNLLPDSDLFLVSFPLVADDDAALHLSGWPPAACSKPNLDSHFTDCACAVLQASFLLLVFVTTKAWETPKEGLRMTSPWTGYSQVDESISYIVCRNRFSSMPTRVSIGKGWNFAIKY